VYRWVDHTSEVELEIEAAGEREVFEEAVRALAELLGAVADATRATFVRRVAVHATDRPALLAAWLEELAFLAEADGFVATHVMELEMDADAVHATVGGVLGAPPPLVKAVTYHRLAFEPSGKEYFARVVLDV